MDIVLGVSMTPTTVRMVLVEGKEANGITIEKDIFETSATEGAATPSAPEQVGSAVLGTRESAIASRHHLVATGVTWNEHACDVAVLRDSLAARGIEDVTLVCELHAAGALARDVGAALAHETMALLFITPENATLAVVETADGTIRKLLSRSLGSPVEIAELTEMVGDLDGPQGLFVVGSGVDIGPLKAHLESHVRLPVSAPEDPELALARGAALAAANEPRAEASTVGIAYSKDPDAESLNYEFAAATGPLSMADVATQTAHVGDHVNAGAGTDVESGKATQGRWLFLPVGSSVAAMVVISGVAVAMTVAANVRPMADQRPGVIEQSLPPVIAAPAPIAQDQPAVLSPPVVQGPPAAAQPIPVTVPPPAPRTVVVKPAPVQKPVDAVVPVAHPTAVVDVPVAEVTTPPVALAPAAVLPPAAVPHLPGPALTLPSAAAPVPPTVPLPQITIAPSLGAPTQYPSYPSSLSPWSPPSGWIPTQQPVQQPLQPLQPLQQGPQWPVLSQPPQILPPQILQWPRQQAPQLQAPQILAPQGTQDTQWPHIPLLPQWPSQQAQIPQIPQVTRVPQDTRWPQVSLLPQVPLSLQ